MSVGDRDRPSRPREHRKVVQEVAERDDVGRIDAALVAQLGECRGLVDTGCRKLDGPLPRYDDARRLAGKLPSDGRQSHALNSGSKASSSRLSTPKRTPGARSRSARTSLAATSDASARSRTTRPRSRSNTVAPLLQIAKPPTPASRATSATAAG